MLAVGSVPSEAKKVSGSLQLLLGEQTIFGKARRSWEVVIGWFINGE